MKLFHSEQNEQEYDNNFATAEATLDTFRTFVRGTPRRTQEFATGYITESFWNIPVTGSQAWLFVTETRWRNTSGDLQHIQAKISCKQPKRYLGLDSAAPGTAIETGHKPTSFKRLRSLGRSALEAIGQGSYFFIYPKAAWQDILDRNKGTQE
jgi:hypothetical protein